ncbi:CTP-dependent diacylglycerol kinase 1 [Trichomonascus vanleenenianus]|uniref:diacylglycerol kinase n=1 Tax=Trichomonascus vanleenenianus TaxID=2268995 RepID=UPI003EC9E352
MKEFIEEDGYILAEAMSPSSSVSSSGVSTEGEDNNKYLKVEDAASGAISKSSSTSSLASLSLILPSHKQFSKLIHKHEVPRKILHVSIGFLTLWLYSIGVSLSQVTPVLMGLLIGIGSCDWFRFRSPEFNRVYCRYVGFLMREKEVDTVNGVVYYLVGLIIVFLVFPKDISLIAVLLLSWADTAASTFGRAFGHLTFRIGRKSFAGSFSAFLAGVLSAWLLYAVFVPQFPEVNHPGEIMWTPDTSRVGLAGMALACGLVGAVSEAIDFIDDNLTIPIVSSSFMWAFVKLTTSRAYDSQVFAR